MQQHWIFIFFFWCISGFKIYGQTDSLILAFKEAQKPEETTAVITKLTEICGTDFKCMLGFYKAMDAMVPEERILNSYYNLGNFFFRKGSMLDAKKVYLDGMLKTKQVNVNHKLLFSYFSSLSNIFYMSNPVKADSAFYYINESERIIVQNNMGEEAYWKPNYNRYLVYIALKNYEKADEYLIRSYGYLKQSQNRMNKGFVLHTVLEAKKNRANKEEFNRYLDEFVRFKKAGNKELDIDHLGIMELFTDKEEAKKLLEASIKRTEANDKPKDSADARRIELADIYTEKGEIDKAIEQYMKIIADPTLADRGMPRRNAHYALYEAYKKKNKPEEAYRWIEKYIALEDSMNNQAFKNQVAEYEVRYQTKEKENQLIKQQLQLREAGLANRSLWMAMIAVLIIFITSGFLYYRNDRFKHQMILKDKEISEQKYRELESKNKVLSLQSVIEGQEAERLRIAQDLHDGLGGLLTTVKAHFQSIHADVHQKGEEQIYDRANKLLDEACIEVRRIAHNMVPYSIKLSGLKGALEDLRDSVETRGLPCELEIYNMKLPDWDEGRSNVLFRIIQEVTTNAVKHSGATKLFIQLMCHSGGLNVLIEDNGCGFEINTLKPGGGMGIKSVESRVHYLGGSVEYDSSPGHGTTVNINLPLQNKQTFADES